jgi:hypothetical protein
MKNYFFVILLFLSFANLVSAQKYYSKAGNIHFISETPLENIEATNNGAYAVMDAGSGQIEWSVLIKGFKFQKALQQEHFNENYMESDKFPKALFKGRLVKGSSVNCSQNGDYKVNVEGDMTIHGITKPLSAPALITVSNGKIRMSGSFTLKIADYGIKVPKVVRNNIAETVQVTVNAELQELK